MTMIYVILVLIAVLVFWFIALRNRIITNENATQRAWADVASFERQKVKILDDLQPLLDRYGEFENTTMTQVSALRQNILNLNQDRQDVAQLEQIEQQTKDLMRGIHVQVEAYPELKANELYQKVMHEITEQNENVGAAINIFNRNVEQFNNDIQIFPNSLVNSLSLNRRAIRPFRDRAANEAFEYRPNFNN
ncbi:MULTISPECIES: LemA family protein [unclassified Acinetobacter]|uniref:LemA family protein n=1 Tax=unclassified Acinetobacter TaxID=196816 RepID=UPI0035B9F9D0